MKTFKIVWINENGESKEQEISGNISASVQKNIASIYDDTKSTLTFRLDEYYNDFDEDYLNITNYIRNILLNETIKEFFVYYLIDDKFYKLYHFGEYIDSVISTVVNPIPETEKNNEKNINDEVFRNFTSSLVMKFYEFK